MRVAVIGAGAIGLFCAARLAQRGCAVTLLEGEAEEFSVYGPTASMAAAGMLAPLGETHATHPRFEELALASFDLWRAWSKDALWADGVRFGGGAAVPRDDRANEDLLRHVNRIGREAQIVSGWQWRKIAGIDLDGIGARPGVFILDEGVADPHRVSTGLCMQARQHGAELRFKSDVFSVTANSVKLTNERVIEADRVVLATGAWATEPLMEAAPALKHVRPAKGHMIEVEFSGALDANFRTEDFYLARRLENDVVLGGDIAFDLWDRHVDPDSVRRLLSQAEAMLPGKVRPRGRAWSGIRAMSPDGAPLVGQSGDVLVASGHSRNGWLLAPITAEIICAHVLGEDIPELWSAFAPQRFD